MIIQHKNIENDKEFVGEWKIKYQVVKYHIGGSNSSHA